MPLPDLLHPAAFRSIVDSLAESVLVTDAEGRIRYASPPIESLSGFTPEELLGAEAFSFLVPEDRARARADVTVLMEGGELPGPSTVRLTRSDGVVIHVEASGRNLLSDPNVRGMVITLRDVTDRSEMEERLRNAEKLEAIGQLAGGIAHDFNNILTAITGHADFAIEELPSGHPLRTDLQEIRDGASRAASLTERLLAFAGRQILVPRLIDLSALVAGMEPELRRSLGPEVKIVIDAVAGHIVRADPGAIRQAILHLSTNAGNAMPAGGELRLTVSPSDAAQPHPDSARAGDSDAHVVLDVEDTGHGMDDAVRSRIFEPFFTTRQVGDGTGLGLAVVLGIIEQSGGFIDVASTPGKGSRFRVRLPRADPTDD